MTNLICRKTMMRCQTPGMCAPYGGCRTEVAIPADQVLVPRELLRQACSDDPTLRASARNALKLRLHP